MPRHLPGRLLPHDLGLICGDFNDTHPELSGEFLDVWEAARPTEEGYTFDPGMPLGEGTCPASSEVVGLLAKQGKKMNEEEKGRKEGRKEEKKESNA